MRTARPEAATAPAIPAPRGMRISPVPCATVRPELAALAVDHEDAAAVGLGDAGRRVVDGLEQGRELALGGHGAGHLEETLELLEAAEQRGVVHWGDGSTRPRLTTGRALDPTGPPKVEGAMRRAKIVATIGPATATPEALEQLLRHGVDVARLNFSHGSHADHARTWAGSAPPRATWASRWPCCRTCRDRRSGPARSRPGARASRLVPGRTIDHHHRRARWRATSCWSRPPTCTWPRT